MMKTAKNGAAVHQTVQKIVSQFIKQYKKWCLSPSSSIKFCLNSSSSTKMVSQFINQYKNGVSVHQSVQKWCLS